MIARTARLVRAALAMAVAALLPAWALAQTLPIEPAPGAWRYAVSLYGYLPSVSGASSVPADSNGTPIGISGDQIRDNLKSMLMGSFEAHNGRWGVFIDAMYLGFGDSRQRSRDFTIGGVVPPVGTTADLDSEFSGSIWTLGAEYRLHASPATTVDALLGVRRFEVSTTLRWSIAGDTGVLLPSGRTGSAEGRVAVLDGIVGVKGRTALGVSGPWSVPFYADVGTGQSDLTWQAAAGISYAFEWGELSALWRYLAFEMKSGKNLGDLSFNGPMIGVTWRW